MDNQKGISKDVRSLLRMIDEADKMNIEYFYLQSLSRSYHLINEPGEIIEYLHNRDISYDDNNFLLNYSGYNYKHINAVLRGTWNYEENGNIENMPVYRENARRLSELIMNNPSELDDDIIAYRGVDIGYFKQYGIETLEDLQMLDGQMLHDRGFVSTSLLEEKCFFGMDNELGLNYNIKMEYMIPCEFRDGIFLGENMSYSPNQQEFVINSGNISKVCGVSIDKENNTATIRTVLIPKEIYDDYYRTRSITTSTI